MAMPPKYTVEYKGETMTMYRYAAIVVIDRRTLRMRIRDGRPVVQPGDAEKARRRKMNREELRRTQREGYEDGYTRQEIEELYRRFAGSEDELQILMDFTGLGRIYAERLLDELRSNMKRSVAS